MNLPRHLFTVPPLLAVIAALMLAGSIALWSTRQCSLAGRLHFSVLTIAGLIAAGNVLLLR